MQQNALTEIYRLEKAVKSTNDINIVSDWRKLQTSDHFYYMCTKWFSDGDVHKYFNPYDSPYDSYINYMNVMENLRSRCADSAEHLAVADTAVRCLPNKSNKLLREKISVAKGN